MSSKAECKRNVSSWKYYPLGMVSAIGDMLERLWEETHVEREKKFLDEIMHVLSEYDQSMRNRVLGKVKNEKTQNTKRK